jgi:hypothetical protein
MLGLKSFRTAARVISGIELAEKIKFKIGKLSGLRRRCRTSGEPPWLVNLNL